MAEDEKVPSAMRPVFDEITAVTDAFCADHLDDEHARLPRRLTAELARKRPHMRTEDLAERFCVKAQTMGSKARLIEDTLRIGTMDPEWCRQDVIVKNPFVWLFEINGYLADARELPEDIQVFLVERGVIPFAPSRGQGT